MRLFTMMTNTATPKIIKNVLLLTTEEGDKAVILDWTKNERNYINNMNSRMIIYSGKYRFEDTSGIIRFMTTRVKTKLENALKEASYPTPCDDV